jgi:ribose-phosphate pyrophosphokinase
MIEAVRLFTHGWPSPICIAVHGLFADDSDLQLERAGARVVTTNSVPHRTNAIELRMLLSDGVKEVQLKL